MIVRDSHKIERKKYIGINVFDYKSNGKYSIYLSKNTFKRHFDLLLIRDKCKIHYVLNKDFNTFTDRHTLQRERKLFYCYWLQAFSATKILKVMLMITLKMMVNKPFKYLKKMNMLDSKIMKGK